MFKRLFYTAFIFFTISIAGYSQCNDWYITSQIIAGSTCGGNGSFSIALNGADSNNITNVQYAITLQPNGYFVPLNNSNVFNNVPPGTYEVQAIGLCNGNYVGKKTYVTMPGQYKPPTLVTTVTRHSLNCGNYGIISISVNNNRPPYTLNIVAAPSTYTGSTSIVFNSSSHSLYNLPAGIYDLQVVDACNNSSFITKDTITNLSATGINLNTGSVAAVSCDSLSINMPGLHPNDFYANYWIDTFYKVSVAISNNSFVATVPKYANAGSFIVKLLPGYTLKDSYGKTITYTIYPPCGNSFQISRTIPYPNPYRSLHQRCNNTFSLNTDFGNLVCYPVTYTINDNNSSNSYGPYITANPHSSPYIPVGSYTVNYTTVDGYTGSFPVSANPVTGNPYSISVLNGSSGLNNYVHGFQFFSNLSLGLKSVELFNGPPGYSYYGSWPSGNTVHHVTSNQTPINPGTMYFPVGNYVWKITDSCGVYYLPITVDSSHLYEYTASIVRQKQTCEGIWVWPSGSAKNNGATKPVEFHFLKDNQPILFTQGTPAQWKSFKNGDSVLLEQDGNYVILPNSSGYPIFIPPYPNPYTQTYSFTLHNLTPVQINRYKTIGFACNSGSAAVIYSEGQDGFPYANGGYKYYLASQGNGNNGPYIDSNTNGHFTNFGGAPNNIFDVKVVDSCGSFSIQEVEILDMQLIKLITNSDYVTCHGDTVTLVAPFIPNATYNWTGPNGFTHNGATVSITSMQSQHIGVYHLTVNIPGCGAITDSTILAMNLLPPKPIVTYDCPPPFPMFLRVTNSQQGYSTFWQQKRVDRSIYQWHGNKDSTVFYEAGHYFALFIDSTTGCVNHSDTLFFANNPNNLFTATIYAPHLKLCAGDTTTLVANSNGVFYQWFKNGAIIQGANSQIYITNAPGNYKVFIDGGECVKDTSDEVTVTVVSIPTASITAPKQLMCIGDSILISANYDTSYEYTWLKDDVTIAGASSSSYTAKESGDYKVVISNGGCIATSNTITITVDDADYQPYLPDDTLICNSSGTMVLRVSNELNNILWSTGATNSSIIIDQPGTYHVQAKTPCGTMIYDTIQVRICTPKIDEVILDDEIICEGSCIHIDANVSNYPESIEWFFEGANPNYYKGLNPPSVCYYQTGTFRIQLLVQNNGGADSFEKHIEVLPVPKGRFEDTVITIPYKSTIRLAACTEGKKISWYKNNDSLVCEDCDSYTFIAKDFYSYYSCVIDNDDCFDTCYYKIHVTDIPSEVYLPSAFTPNKDGKNDVFKIITDNPNVIVEKFLIVNRWGQTVFSTDNLLQGWDGNFKGNPAELGVYFWSLKYKITGNSKAYFMKGDVSLIR